jgi:hypothetical protein
MACEAFEEYRLNSVKFSAQELEILKKQLKNVNPKDISLFNGTSFVSKKGEQETLTGEGIEFQDKLSKLISED